MESVGLYWYVLFVRTGLEERLVKILNNELNSQLATSFILEKIFVFRRQGKKTLFSKNCFPGYMFLESKLPAPNFAAYMFPILRRYDDIYRFLTNGDKQNYNNIAMNKEEQSELSRLFGKERRIDISTGFKDGDSIRVHSGPLAGHESKILKINKNRQNAVIAINMFGNVSEVSVGFDVIEKMPHMQL
ncbi:MAG: antiterminator LoaP [Firmicutes bacterium]|nr:antiterminator LoaP [Bacillota bacterium]